LSEYNEGLVTSAAQVAFALFAELSGEHDAIDEAEVTLDVKIDERMVGRITIFYRPLPH
jgi:hypothetical protein